MKFIILIFAFIYSIQCSGQASHDSLLKALVGIEQKLADGIATGDKKLWDEHLHDSCMISVEDGTTISKKKMIEELDPLPAGYVGRIKIINPNLKVYGNTAVLSFVDDEYLDLYNQHIHTQYRQINTWVKINGKWEKIAMQLFEIPKNPTPVTINSSILKQYVGKYSLSAERTAVVYVENGKLYVKKKQERSCRITGSN